MSNIYTNILLCTLRVRRFWKFRKFRNFQLFWCSGRSELLKIAQGAPRAAQSRSEPLRLALWARPGPLRAAQSRSESLRARPEPLRARPEPSPRAVRAAQRRSESLGACPEPLRAAQSRPERSLGAVRGTAQGRTERAQSCSAPLRIARCVPRAAQSRSESPRAVGQSCSKNRSGSSVSRALCISSAQFCLTWFSLLRACICTGSY